MKNRTALYDRVWRDLYVTLMGGIRIYYPDPIYFTQEQLGRNCCTIFKMKQRISADLLSELRSEEYPDRKDQHKIDLDLYADRLKQEVVANTWDKGPRKLSQSITYEWPATPFEDWLEDNVESFWMTAEWFQVEGAGPFDDFAFMVSVHTPLSVTKNEWDEAYGEAFVMTKLMHY